MSRLVAYESSSDEDDPTEKPTAPSELLSNTDQSNHEINRINENSEHQSQPGLNNQYIGEAEAPVLGPTIESTTYNVTDGYASPSGQSMSERDTIRYLTQTSYPVRSLPSSPPGSPDLSANLKIKKFLDLKEKDVHFNEDLARKSAFRNPALLDTLMDRTGIDSQAQYSSSLPSSLWDPDNLPAHGYKEELLKSQQMIRDQDAATKKILSASGKRTIEFTSGGGSGQSSKNSTPGQFSKKRKP